MTWLLTGGAGYIGSHVARSLLASGREVVVLDDLSTGHIETIPAGVPLAQGSVGDTAFVVETLRHHDVTGVIHLAAKKAVGESVELPLYYYRENVDGILSLLEAMTEVGVKNFVYSSSAGVYGEPETSPVLEDGPTVPMSPYGETKLIGEWLTRDSARIRGDLSWIALRYFNVAGAGAPELGDTSVANLIPIVLRAVANNVTPQVFGDDYPTPDGTCIRDYIHVADLADAHVQAAAVTESEQIGNAINIGTGNGDSVLDVITSISRALNQPVPHQVVARRAGDPAELVAAIDKAESVLNWTASLDLDAMTESAVAAQRARKS
jgi:UDP-glucose 4-epimerase